MRQEVLASWPVMLSEAKHMARRAVCCMATQTLSEAKGDIPGAVRQAMQPLRFAHLHPATKEGFDQVGEEGDAGTRIEPGHDCQVDAHDDDYPPYNAGQ